MVIIEKPLFLEKRQLRVCFPRFIFFVIAGQIEFLSIHGIDFNILDEKDAKYLQDEYQSNDSNEILESVTEENNQLNLLINQKKKIMQIAHN
jgi:hypothetical protein